MDETRWDLLDAAQYLALVTFRRDGTPVSTPVWFAAHPDGVLVVQTGADTGKVKRVRGRSCITVAPCDMRGRPRAAALPGRASILDDAAREQAQRLLQQKYGWKRTLYVGGGSLVLRLRGKPAPASVVLGVAPADESSAGAP